MAGFSSAVCGRVGRGCGTGCLTVPLQARDALKGARNTGSGGEVVVGIDASIDPVVEMLREVEAAAVARTCPVRWNLWKSLPGADTSAMHRVHVTNSRRRASVYSCRVYVVQGPVTLG